MYHAIYLSPHLDDAALSCGGQIAQQTAEGLPVLIVNLMAGDPPARPLSPFAQMLHDRWQLADAASAVAARRAEDTAACQILAAVPHYWSVPDCIYRHTPHGEPLYQSNEAIFGPIHPADEQLAAELATQLAQLPPAVQVVAPLGVGHHVDHQLTRLAAELWQPAGLCYYEDYPYAQQEGAVTAALGNPAQWRAQSIPLSAEALRRKCAAIAAYVSQVSSFFRDTADLEAQIATYAAQVGGEQLWTPSP